MTNNYQAKTKIFCERRIAKKILNKIGNAGWVNQSDLRQRLSANDVNEFEVCVYHTSLKSAVEEVMKNELKWEEKTSA